MDVDYTFAQVGNTTEDVGYGGNGGHIPPAVCPFDIEPGLVDNFRSGVASLDHPNTQEVRIFVTGTNSILISYVPVDQDIGCVVEERNFVIAAVPGSGVPISMD